MTLYDIPYYVELVALFCASYFHFKQRTSRSRILLILLTTVVAFESIAKFELIPGMNLIVINSIVLIELMLYYLLFTLLMDAGKRRRWVVSLAVLFTVFWLINAIYIQPLTTHIQTNSYILGASGLLVAILLYFYQDLLVSKRNNPLHQRYFLWVSAGLFIFLATDIPIMGILNYMIDNQVPINEMPVFKVKSAVTILYYLTYPIGLLWMRTE